MSEIVRAELHLRLPWPISINSYKMPIVKGRIAVMTLTKRGRQYHHDVMQAVMDQLGRIPRPFLGRLRIAIELRPPDRRVRDIDNSIKTLLDSLTFAKVWQDDSQLDELTIYRGQQIQGGKAIVIVSPLGPDPTDPTSGSQQDLTDPFDNEE